jgi:hypothetical protein
MRDPKGGRPPGLCRIVLKRDLRGRPVETAPFDISRVSHGKGLGAEDARLDALNRGRCNRPGDLDQK